MEKGHKLSPNIYNRWWYNFIAIHDELKYPKTTCSKLLQDTKPTTFKQEEDSKIFATLTKHSSVFDNQTQNNGTNRAKKTSSNLITKNINKMNIENNWQWVD